MRINPLTLSGQSNATVVEEVAVFEDDVEINYLPQKIVASPSEWW